MSVKYKSFREHLLECKDSGNLMEIDVSRFTSFPEIILVCAKYKSMCHSGVCRGERIGEEDEYPGDVEY